MHQKLLLDILTNTELPTIDVEFTIEPRRLRSLTEDINQGRSALAVLTRPRLGSQPLRELRKEAVKLLKSFDGVNLCAVLGARASRLAESPERL